MVADMFEKPRYKGDALGQAAMAGVKVGMVVTSINGRDARTLDFEDVMDLLADIGVMDPDSMSAGEWGEASKGFRPREKLEPAEVPVSLGFVAMAGKGAVSGSLSLNGVVRQDCTVGVVLPGASSSYLDVCGLSPMGPELPVGSAGVEEEGGLYTIRTVDMAGKNLPAAAALKMAAQMSGLKDMKGICVGLPRPESAPAAGTAGKWAVYPLASVTKSGGLVIRCKGMRAEGLGPDDGLKRTQFFCPDSKDAENLAGCPAGSLLFTATSEVPNTGGAFGLAGVAVLGAGVEAEPRAKQGQTAINRQAAALVQGH